MKEGEEAPSVKAGRREGGREMGEPAARRPTLKSVCRFDGSWIGETTANVLYSLLRGRVILGKSLSIIPLIGFPIQTQVDLKRASPIPLKSDPVHPVPSRSFFLVIVLLPSRA